MKGIGRSIRENAQRSYLHHCGDVATIIFRVDCWYWKRWVKALWTLTGLPLALVFVVLSPVLIPWIAYCNKSHAVKAVEEWERKREKIMN